MRGSLIILGCFILGVFGPAWGAEPDASRLAERYVVITNSEASFRIPDAPPRPARVGYRYLVSHTQGSWVWVVRMGGWLDAGDVVLEAEAADHFSSLIKSQPSAEHFYQRAVMWSVRQDYARGMADYEAAIALEPDNSAAHAGLGSCYWALGRFDEALSILERAIELDAANAQAYNNRGNVWRSLGRLSEARADYAEAARLSPSHGTPRSNLGSCHLAEGRYSEAIAEFDAALRLEPFDPEGFNDRGYARQRQGDYQRAMEDYQRSVQYDDACYQAYNNAAWLRATCPNAAFRNGELAVRVAETACQLTDFRNWYCLATLAAAHAENGAFEDAVTAQRRAMGLLPPDVTSAEWQEQQHRLELYLAAQPYREAEPSPIAFRPAAGDPHRRNL